MTDDVGTGGRLLLLAASGAGGVENRLRVELAEPAVRRGWRIAVVLSPTAGRWMCENGELARIQELTDLPVRFAARKPEAPANPAPDAALFAPATANSIAKLALGIYDTQALFEVAQAVGTPGVPVLLRPKAPDPFRAHPVWSQHLATLKAAGVEISDAPAEQPWEPLLDLLHH
ncbi:MAG TPA: flavoprotein [Pseudonocardiaceae bacterium]